MARQIVKNLVPKIGTTPENEVNAPFNGGVLTGTGDGLSSWLAPASGFDETAHNGVDHSDIQGVPDDLFVGLFDTEEHYWVGVIGKYGDDAIPEGAYGYVGTAESFSIYRYLSGGWVIDPGFDWDTDAATPHAVSNHLLQLGVPYIANTVWVDSTISASINVTFKTLKEACDYVSAQSPTSVNWWNIILRTGQSHVVSEQLVTPPYTVIMSEHNYNVGTLSEFSYGKAIIKLTAFAASLPSGYAITMSNYSYFCGVTIEVASYWEGAVLSKDLTIFGPLNNACTNIFINTFVGISLYSINANNYNISLIEASFYTYFFGCKIMLYVNGTNVNSGENRLFYMGDNNSAFSYVQVADSIVTNSRGTGKTAITFWLAKDEKKCVNVVNTKFGNDPSTGQITAYFEATPHAETIMYIANSNVTTTNNEAKISRTARLPGESLDETAHDLLDHTGLTGIPDAATPFDWDTDAATPHSLVNHAGIPGVGTGSGEFVWADDAATPHAAVNHKGIPGVSSYGSLASNNITVDPSSWRNFTIAGLERALITKLQVQAIDGNATPDMNYDIEIFEDAAMTTYAYRATGITTVNYIDLIPWEWFGGETLYGRIINNKAAAMTDVDVTIHYRL